MLLVFLEMLFMAVVPDVAPAGPRPVRNLRKDLNLWLEELCDVPADLPFHDCPELHCPSKNPKKTSIQHTQTKIVSALSLRSYSVSMAIRTRAHRRCQKKTNMTQ
jgi:hypothetical protein